MLNIIDLLAIIVIYRKYSYFENDVRQLQTLMQQCLLKEHFTYLFSKSQEGRGSGGAVGIFRKQIMLSVFYLWYISALSSI